MRTRVVNIRDAKCDVRIDRTTKWGNPFKIGPDGDRADVIRKHMDWFKSQPHLINALPELKGKKLGCWCVPLPCHGDNLVLMLEEAPK